MFHHDQNIWRKAIRLAALCSTLGAQASGVLAAPLTEIEALRIGNNRPEWEEIAQARLGEADADMLETRTWANPTLEFEQDKTGAARETTWKLSQPVDISGRRGLRNDAAELRRTAVEAENRTRHGQRSTEIRRAFHELLRQQLIVQAYERWVARFGQISGVVEKLSRAGEASGYDRRRLLREQRTGEARLAEARADADLGRSRLDGLLAQNSSEGVAGHLLPDPPASLDTVKESLTKRPELAALAARAEAASTENVAARRMLPEVTFGISSKQVDDGIVRETGTIFSVSAPLPIFDRQQAADRRSSAQAMATRAELALARQRAEAELFGLHRQTTQLIATADRYRKEAVTPSADLVRIAEVAYRAGESSILELLDAYKGALEAETTAIDLEWKARQARIELDQLTGNYPQ